ncbi:hypothetical protein K438DRAFT_1783308 [Mycena galopus ATCC 62051]|nr:hypothetical protein K438DRAFT_1783308 [Mycena galopus ATCC 62051]
MAPDSWSTQTARQGATLQTPLRRLACPSVGAEHQFEVRVLVQNDATGRELWVGKCGVVKQRNSEQETRRLEREDRRGCAARRRQNPNFEQVSADEHKIHPTYGPARKVEPWQRSEPPLSERARTVREAGAGREEDTVYRALDES